MSVMKPILWASYGLFAVAAMASRRSTGDVCDSGCAPPPPPACQPQTVERTIMVPEIVTEYHTRRVTRFRPEAREREVVVYRTVPATRTIEEEYTAMVPETRTRTVADVINHPVYRDIELRTTAMAPQVEARQSTRTVCRLMPFQEQRTVCEVVPSVVGCAAPVSRTVGYGGVEMSVADAAGAQPALPPNWHPPRERSDPNAPPSPTHPGTATSVDRLPVMPPPSAPPPSETVGPIGPTCGACQPACTTCPQVVQRTINVTCMKPVEQQETIQYPVTHFKPNVEAQTVSFYEYEPETVTHEESYVVDVPERRVRAREVSTTRTVAEKQMQPYTELVPYEDQIQVPVCTLRCVPKKITVPAAPSCGACSGS
jgi:hypothetical protein